MTDTDKPMFPLSRRGFLYGAGSGVVSATLAGRAVAQDAQVPIEPVGRPMPELRAEPPIDPERRVGYAIVGLGQYALNQIMPSFGETRYSRITALVSGDREKAEEVARMYGIDPENIYNYDNMEEMAQKEAIDAVYIITPPAFHAEQSIVSSRAGKHVMCEKPMAMDAQECRAMIDAAEEANRLLMIGYRSQYEPHNLEAIERIRNGELGDVRIVHTENSYINDPETPAGEWRIQRSLAGGGSLYDIGIYGVQGARYLLGEEPIEVMAQEHTPEEGFGDVEDVVTWQFRFASGVRAVGSTSFSTEANRFGVSGTEGYLELQPATDYYGHRLTLRDEDGTREVDIDTQGPSQFARQLDHLSEAILNGGTVATPGEEGMQDIRIMQAIYESVRTGQPVPIDWAYGEAD
jgi:glucose-fructose oxidoreductase